MKEYKVSGMSCGNCVNSVRTIAQQHGAGADVAVDLASGKLSFTPEAGFDEAALIDAVEAAGFDIEAQ